MGGRAGEKGERGQGHCWEEREKPRDRRAGETLHVAPSRCSRIIWKTSVWKSELGGWGRGEERDSGWREGEKAREGEGWGGGEASVDGANKRLLCQSVETGGRVMRSQLLPSISSNINVSDAIFRAVISHTADYINV